MPSPSTRFVNDLHHWYQENKRNLSWRHTTDPYKILVSEVMLQQTQVDRVIPKYEIFLESFPTVFDLANASPARVIAIWHGLGYNRRALNLHKGAKEVVEKWNGVYPQTPKELQEIPGIGPYTSAAVASFAFNHHSAVVDTNVIRVLIRVFIGTLAMKDGSSKKHIDKLSMDILPEGASRIHNNAIMEFGALICQAKPRCGSCFASSYCRGFQDLKKGLLTETELSFLGTPKGGFGTVQSRFEGSDRQIRGRIIALLSKPGTKTSGATLLHKLRTRFKMVVPPQKFQNLIQKLSNEGMVTIQGDLISLPGQ